MRYYLAMEKLDSEKQKEIISKLVQKLYSSDPNLYYTDSSTIASMVVEMIPNASLNQEELQLVQSLKASDVLVLMSYRTKCC